MLNIVESKKPPVDVARDLEQAVTRHKFGVLGVHDLKAKMAEKGVPFARECPVFEVCNPHQAKKGARSESRDLDSAALPDLGVSGGRGNQGGHHQAHRDDRALCHSGAAGGGQGGQGDAQDDHGGGGRLTTTLAQANVGIAMVRWAPTPRSGFPTWHGCRTTGGSSRGVSHRPACVRTIQ
jgi:hypothetical protein